MTKALTFLRIPKNASTSAYEFFGVANTIRNEYLDSDNSKFLNVFESSHCTLSEAKQLLGDCVAEFPIMAIVRNPYERMVSMFFFAKKHDLGKLYDISLETFELFVEGFSVLSKNPDFFHAYTQSKFIGKDNSVTICRFESLNDDISNFISDNDIPFNIESFKHLNSTEHDDYKSYYTDKSKNTVMNMWKDDLIRFSYSF